MQHRLAGTMVVFCAVAQISALSIQAQVHSPRVLSPHVADTYSMRTFAEFPRWRDLEGNEKVYEIYAYLADRETGLYPMGTPPHEGRDPWRDFTLVRCPVKALNVHPGGHCGTLGPIMEGVITQMGIGPARTVMIPGHVLAEAFIDGAWRYLDLDLRGVFRRLDGSLASFQEARADASLWEPPAGPLFFPHGPRTYRANYLRASNPALAYGFATGGHTMSYVLRTGETLTRWFQPQGGRWSHHPTFNTGSARRFIEREPRGPKPKHANWSVYTYGNGRFDYRPDLTERSDDFAAGVYDSHNVRPGPAGLTLREPGDGFAVFEVRSPYIIVPLVGDLDTTDDDSEASIVAVEGEGLALSVSTDNGRNWREIGAAGTHDLTPFASGRYGYLLKVALRGEPERALLRTLSMTTWVQLNPVSLPALRAGNNRMRYVTGDHHGLPTRVMELRNESTDDFTVFLSEPPRDFDPEGRPLERARGPFLARVEAPPGMRVAWFSAGGAFRTHRRDAAADRTRNTMAWAAGAPENFTEFYRSDKPRDTSHWHYNVDEEVMLDEPARVVYIRYVGDPAINTLRIYAYCVAESPRPSAPPIVITHAWREDGERKTHVERLDAPGAYEIGCGNEPENESIEFAVPSSVSVN